MEQGAQQGRGRRVSGLPRFRLLPKREGDPRASVVAFVVQLTLIILIVPLLVVPIAFDFLRDDSGRAVTPERISFVVALPSGPSTREAPRAGGDGRVPVENPTPAVPIVAPTATPSGVVTPSGPPRAESGGVGPLVGGGGPTQGIRPSFNDRRIWSSPSDIVVAPLIPMTRADSLRVLLQATAEAYVDSMIRANPQSGRRPGDWTFERGGKKYGIDPQFIRLGDFSIPTALLALLPLNVQANPIGQERARRLSSMRSEIMEQAERRLRDDDFFAAVKALRERKEKERQEAAEERKRADVVPPTS